METTIGNSLVLIAMLGAITDYANLLPSKTRDETIKKTILNLDNVEEGERLFIKSENGIIVYKESIKKSGDYNKEFDFTDLPNGNYHFEHGDNFKIKVIPFNVSFSRVTFAKKS